MSEVQVTIMGNHPPSVVIVGRHGVDRRHGPCGGRHVDFVQPLPGHDVELQRIVYPGNYADALGPVARGYPRSLPSPVITDIGARVEGNVTASLTPLHPYNLCPDGSEQPCVYVLVGGDVIAKFV